MKRIESDFDPFYLFKSVVNLLIFKNDPDYSISLVM